MTHSEAMRFIGVQQLIMKQFRLEHAEFILPVYVRKCRISIWTIAVSLLILSSVFHWMKGLWGSTYSNSAHTFCGCIHSSRYVMSEQYTIDVEESFSSVRYAEMCQDL
ncbi:hypothetical protein SCHPADRAFT_911611 [Schizopora paradoxa]|uniref:Uncharacterized protein n=1 Tax=Schizopora paradoxa TaxID=27342 RepID=A0A0H2QZT7_9AGAM|nr:hypothetical protein SCHPADRAFT_911611 [Schizopora paradoxa]